MSTGRINQIKSVLSSIIKAYGLEKKIKEISVLTSWEEIVGENISRFAKATRIKKGVLIVSVENSTWRNELSFMKSQIIDKINKHLNEEIVKDIIFR